MSRSIFTTLHIDRYDNDFLPFQGIPEIRFLRRPLSIHAAQGRRDRCKTTTETFLLAGFCLEENKFFPVSTFPGDVYRAPNRSVCSFPIHCRSSFVFVFLWLALESKLKPENAKKSESLRREDEKWICVVAGCVRDVKHQNFSATLDNFTDFLVFVIKFDFLSFPRLNFHGVVDESSSNLPT